MKVRRSHAAPNKRLMKNQQTRNRELENMVIGYRRAYPSVPLFSC
jgi:hypothetical protein